MGNRTKGKLSSRDRPGASLLPRVFAPSYVSRQKYLALRTLKSCNLASFPSSSTEVAPGALSWLRKNF